jgi:hypothetical protein
MSGYSFVIFARQRSSSALYSSARQLGKTTRYISVLIGTALVLVASAHAADQPRKILHQSPTRRQTSVVAMAAQAWSDTATTAPISDVHKMRFIGHLAGYAEEKRAENRNAEQLRPSTTAQPEFHAETRVRQLSTSSSTNITFDGPSESDTNIIPPDPVIATGQNNIVVAVNTLLAIYDKTGTQQGSFQDLNTFFGALGVRGEIFDPRLIYDQQDNRFILSAGEADFTNFTNGHVLLAVSQTGDPTGIWYKFAIDFMGKNSAGTANTFPDFPGLGLSASAIYLTSNQFQLNAQCLSGAADEPCPFSDTWIKVIGLPELLAGNPALNITTFEHVLSASGQLAFSIQPALTLGASSSEFLAAASFSANPGHVLNVFSINTSGAPLLQAADVNVPSFWLPPDAPQPGSSTTILTDDFRTLNAIWINDQLWCGQNVGDTNSPNPVARWYEIQASDISTAMLLQSGNIFAAGAAYYPAISQKADGTVGVTFTTSSQSLPASAGFTARQPSDPAGTMRSYSIYRQGSATYTDQGDNRWGDYSGIAVDPDGGSFWTTAEYAGTPNPHFGTAVAQQIQAPSLFASPGRLDFGGILVGQSSTVMTAAFTNIGTASISLGMVAKTGNNVGDFSITADQCSGISLAPSQSCQIGVAFKPTQQAFETGYLAISYASGEVVVGISGTGLIQAVLSITPSALSFPATVQQTASAPQTITIANTGNASAQLTGFGGTLFSLVGPFTQSNNCASAIAPGGSCQFTIVFHPTAAASFQGSLLFNANTQQQVYFILLLGTGSTAPATVFCPSGLDFGNQAQGTTSATQTVILTNSGSKPLTLTGISVTGDFMETDNCVGSVPVRASCNISVRFIPSVLGQRNGSISVSDDAQGSPQLVTLTGSGITGTAGIAVAGKDSAVATSAFRETDRKLVDAARPLAFEPNVGQFPAEVKYVAHVPGYEIALTSAGAVFGVQGGVDRHGDRVPHGRPLMPARVRMVLANIAGGEELVGSDQLVARVNYFIGSDRDTWRTNIPTYGRVNMRDVYPGIDLSYYGSSNRLEYDFIVSPGADPRKIQLGFDGASDLRVTSTGELKVSTAAGDLELKAPLVYQFTNASTSSKVYRAGRWEVKGSRAAFALGSYDRKQPLIIDPVLSFATYLGGTGGEEGDAIALDSSGNVYVAGRTYSLDFPVSANALLKSCGSSQFPCTPFEGRDDGFVAKLSPDGSTLLYATYIGASAGDNRVYAIAVDSAGNAYVAGQAGGPDFPTTQNAFEHCSPKSTTSCASSFVAKLDPAGSSLLYSTYLGGTPTFFGANLSAPDIAKAIAIDASGDAYVGGVAGRPDFPVTAGAFETTPPDVFGVQGFLSKLNADGTALLFSTFLGGSRNENVTALAVDQSGSVYVTGTTDSLDFPTTAGAYQTGTYGADSFMAKFTPAGSLVFATLLGADTVFPGFNSTTATAGIVVDRSGAAYVTGVTGAEFPVTNGAFDPIRPAGGGSNAFVAKLHPAGCALLYGTYLNATSNFASSTTGRAIGLDAKGNLYVAGTFGQNPGLTNPFPLVNPLQPILAVNGSTSGSVSFVSELDPTGSQLLFSTPFSGSAFDSLNAMAIDANGDIFLTGLARSQDMPIASPLQPACSACASTFGATTLVARINPGQSTAVSITRQSLVFPSVPVNFVAGQTQAVGVMNNQSQPLNIQSVALQGSGYSIVSNSCKGSLAPGTGCVVSVQFLPTTGGSLPGAIVITDDGPASPRQIALNGFGGADFTVLAQRNNPLIPVLKGTDSTTYNVGLNPIAGAPLPTSGNVQLSCSGNGAVTCSFNPSSVATSIASGSGSVLTLTNLSSVSGTNFDFVVNATLGTQIASVAAKLTLADFAITSAQPSVTVKAGQSAGYPLSISPINGFNSSVSFSCSNLPAHAACLVSPAPLFLDGHDAATATLTITTTSTSATATAPIEKDRPGVAPVAMLSSTVFTLALCFAALVSCGKRRWSKVAPLILAGSMWVACGSGGGGTGGSAPIPPPPTPTTFLTPSGTYTITVTAGAGNLQHSVQVTLIVN